MLLLVVTMVAGTTVNGAKLWIRFGGVQVQPGEFAKLLLVIFLAGYLREKREVLTMAHRRVLGHRHPRRAHLGPLLAMTGLALGVVAVMNDLGTALLLFGIFLAMLYVATGRHAYTVVGLGLFAAGSWFIYQIIAARPRALHSLDRPLGDPAHHRVSDRPVDRGDRRRRRVRHRPGQELPAGRHAAAPDHPGRPDRRHLRRVGRRGRAGRRRGAAAGVPAVRLPRASRSRRWPTDGFSKLLAAGLTFAFALQAFLIVGGVTRLVPLTGITLPFVSYGGSSIVSNFLLLALLLMVSDRATQGPRVNRQITVLFRLSRDRLRGADHDDRLLADLGGAVARRAPGQRPAGVPPAADQARA